MLKRLLLVASPLVLVMGLLAARVASTPALAQMGPMSGQPLEQLSGDDFDQAFLAQMTMHHAMAILMAQPVAANAQHQEIKDLAATIIADQTREIAQMRQWARDWYGVDLPDPLTMMAGMSPDQPSMGHQGHTMPGMPGMPSGAQMPMGPMAEMSMMADFWRLPPQRLEATFLSLMVPHHQGAIEMAQLAESRAAHQEIKDLAANIINSQAAEIQQMDAWLATLYRL